MLSFVAYFETLLQLSLHLCQFTCTLRNLGENIFLSFFLKKCLFSVFPHIEAQLPLKNARLLPVFFFGISIAGDMMYLSHMVITWEKYFPLVGTVLKQIGLPLRGRPILLFTRMITDRSGLHLVPLPLLTEYQATSGSFFKSKQKKFQFFC